MWSAVPRRPVAAADAFAPARRRRPAPPRSTEPAGVVQPQIRAGRTWRNLADCTMVIEELWWKALDFASLKHSSVSFFNGGKPEMAASRWARATTRVAKLGKGLSKNGKAQKLPRHTGTKLLNQGISMATICTSIVMSGPRAWVQSPSFIDN